MDASRTDLAIYRLKNAKQCIISAFDIRSDSDYDDYFIVSKQDVEKQITNAQYFYEKSEEYIMKQDGYDIS